MSVADRLSRSGKSKYLSIPISRTYTVSDTIPILFDVPISISLDETPLGSLKGDIQSYLLELADELSQPQ